MGSSPSKDKYRSDKPAPEFVDIRSEVVYTPHYERNQPHYCQYQPIVYTDNSHGWQSRPPERFYTYNPNSTKNSCYAENDWVPQFTIPPQHVYTEFKRTDRGHYGAISPHYTAYEHAGYSRHNATKQTADQRLWPDERSSLQKEVKILRDRLHTQTEQNSSCKREISKLNEDVRNLDARLTTVTSERDMYLRELQQTHAEFTNFKAGASTTERRQQQKMLELQQESDDLRTRLSSVYGAKLQDNNPNIADLSDKNRPTKLAERFSELYDNEWTNCFEVVSKRHGSTEKDTIQILLKVCLTIYEQCRATAAAELTELIRAIDPFDAKEPVPMLKNLKDSRKKNYQSGIKRIEETIKPRIADLFKTDFDDFDVKEYWHKCLDICWLMAIQDPPVSMETNAERNGELFDHGRYRHYTKAGKYIDFIVWPALNMTAEGSILYKGVAQGKDTP